MLTEVSRQANDETVRHAVKINCIMTLISCDLPLATSLQLCRFRAAALFKKTVLKFEGLRNSSREIAFGALGISEPAAGSCSAAEGEAKHRDRSLFLARS
jgi:hypothetical protein